MNIPLTLEMKYTSVFYAFWKVIGVYEIKLEDDIFLVFTFDTISLTRYLNTGGTILLRLRLPTRENMRAILLV